jgi:hypothetical protein
MDDPRLLGNVLHERYELEVHGLLPDPKRRDEEVVDGRDGRRLDEQLGLRAALLSRDEDLGDRRRFGVRVLPMRLTHEVATQRDQEQDAEASPREADEDRLERVG